MFPNKRIAVAGAGSIGCFVGGMLAAAGHQVTLLARARVVRAVQSKGLRLTSFEGLDRQIAATQLRISESPTFLSEAGVVLVTVKSVDTPEIAGLIAGHARADAVIVSLQNGVDNAPVLQERLRGRRVLGGMVPFNVIALGAGRYHRATSGDILIERDDTGVAEALSVPDLRMHATDDIIGVQWGKLILNLNNALNALAGLPLRQQLAQRSWRRLLADQMAESLTALKAEGIHPVSLTPVPIGWTPHLLRLPDVLFRIVLGAAMKIDPSARSSMWEDLQRGRRSEIDHLQGVIANIADRRGLKAPLTRRVLELIKRAEAEAKGSPGMTPEQIAG
jgi:2-dehydropantoate 2-reductase